MKMTYMTQCSKESTAKPVPFPTGQHGLGETAQLVSVSCFFGDEKVKNHYSKNVTFFRTIKVVPKCLQNKFPSS